ncbi:MAG: class I SAM-dependent methyltransferase [Acidimicrobiales bacterium]|nr:MAG: class I SAM-dependent methyltransferase [Acidimicrobiales bacterium]
MARTFGRSPTVRPREWDADSYDKLPLPHLRWGEDLLTSMKLRGDETVLDAGCGTGRDTAKLLEHLPHGHVIAVDGSRAMLDRLTARFAGHADASRLTVIHADLTQPLPLHDPVDAIFSVATLHWLPNHDQVFAHLASVLRPGGSLHAEWGGQGNLAAIERVLSQMRLPALGETLNFPTAEDTHRSLANAGFIDASVALHPDPARLHRGEQLESFLAVVVLGPLLDRLPAERHQALVHDVASQLAAPEIDYVRLQAHATRK